MSKRRASDELYSAARTARDLEAVASGNPKRIARRIKNKILGARRVPRLAAPMALIACKAAT